MNERILAGRYRLQETVGGKPDWFHALDESLSRKVAVKRLAEHIAASTRQNWEQEIAKAAGMHDPHLLAVYDVVVEDDTLYLITEDLEGDTLARWIREQGPLAPDTAVGLIWQLTNAAVQAEKNGLHQISIDPKAVLVGRGGYLKVIEYGPLFSGSRAPSDKELIFMAGTLLYEMVTGQTYSELAPVRQIVQDVNAALAAAVVPSWLPQRVERIVHRALGVLSEGGYPSMQDLHRDVRMVQHALAQSDEKPAPDHSAQALGPRAARAAAAEPPREQPAKAAIQATTSKAAARADKAAKAAERIKEMAEKRLPKRSPKLYVIGMLVLLVVCGGLWWTLSDSTSATLSEGQAQSKGKQVKMPNLINKTEQQATQVLTENGFPPSQIQWVYKPTDEEVTQGKIYQQSVDPNTQVTTGGEVVSLTINGTMTDGSTGSAIGEGTQPSDAQQPSGKQGEVPDLKGLSQDQAAQLLLKLGYRYSFEILQGDTASGTIFRQSPAAGSKAAAGTRVTFSVSQ
jgi:eukaryotic-like serine/threonine-protein kinase